MVTKLINLNSNFLFLIFGEKKGWRNREKYETILSAEILIIFVEKKKGKNVYISRKISVFFYFSAYMCIDKNCHIPAFSNWNNLSR